MRFQSKVLFILAFLVTTVVLSWSSFLAIKEILRYSDYPLINLYSDNPKTFPKVVLLGNSRAGSNFSDTAFVPGDFLNLGMGGTLFDILSRQALDMIERNPKLQYVILEPYFLVNEKSAGRRAYIEALFSERIEEYLWNSFSDFEKFATILFPSYWLNTPNFLDALMSVFFDRPKRQIVNDKRVNPKVFDEETIRRKRAKTYSPISETVIKQLQVLQQACEYSGVTLLIVVSPIHHFHWQSEGWKNHISELIKVSSELGITFFDYSESLSGGDMFADSVHLNRAGADYMSEVLYGKTLGREASL